MGFGVAIYVFTKELEQAVQIMEKHLGYPRADWVYVDRLLDKYLRGSHRTIYFCGTGYERPDFKEARSRARALNWTIKDELPPRSSHVA